MVMPTPPDHAQMAQEMTACAHSRITRHSEPAGRAYSEPTGAYPGGWHDLTKDVWWCDDCHNEFLSAQQVAEARRETWEAALTLHTERCSECGELGLEEPDYLCPEGKEFRRRAQGGQDDRP